VDTNDAVTDLATLKTRDLHALADIGDAKALELLRKRHRDDPRAALKIGDLAAAALRLRLAQMLDSKAAGTSLAIEVKVESIIREIVGENPTPMEYLLAQRVAMCWLDVQDHECRYANLDQDSSPKRYEWRSRMLDRAHRRYMSALKTLATVRRLNVPMVQVNIAEKQINTVGQRIPD
jgi:hypothetical protein